MAGEKSIGGLWLKTGKSGQKFFSGQIEIDGVKHNFVVFKNTYKQEGSNQPDYKIMPAMQSKQSEQEDENCPF